MMVARSLPGSSGRFFEAGHGPDQRLPIRVGRGLAAVGKANARDAGRNAVRRRFLFIRALRESRRGRRYAPESAAPIPALREG